MKKILIVSLVFTALTSFAQESKEQNTWKLKFHFGFSRTNYLPTDLHINSTEIKATVEGQKFAERTSAHHYNIFRKDQQIKDAFKFIDEPTNTLSFSVENENNAFYISAYHPKYMKSFLYKKNTDESGYTSYEFGEIGESDNFSQSIPEGWNYAYMGETHKRMDWSLGYARKIHLLKSKGWKINYNPRFELGVSTGIARSVRIVPGEAWDDYKSKPKIQGYAIAAGHRIEVERGKFSIYIDQKIVYSSQDREFFDGNLTYKVVYIPTTFGLAYEVFEFRNKQSKKAIK